MGEMPRANLCNRLVVTSTRKNTPFSSAALSHRCPSLRLLHVQLDEKPNLLYNAACEGAEVPLLAIFGLEWPGSWCCLGQLLSEHPPGRGLRCPAWSLPQAFSAHDELGVPNR